MDAQRAIATLDAQLSRNGQVVTLRRTAMSPSGSPVVCDASCLARVRDYRPHESLPGTGLQQGDSHVVISPTAIDKARWPGPEVLLSGGRPSGLDPRLPQASRGDKIIIRGRARSVIACVPTYLQDALVRLDVTVRG